MTMATVMMMMTMSVVNNVCWVRRSCSGDSDGGALGTHHNPYRLCNIIMISLICMTLKLLTLFSSSGLLFCLGDGHKRERYQKRTECPTQVLTVREIDSLTFVY